MTTSDFVSQWSGKFVQSPHGILGQCVSVSSEWCVENGWPELSGATALEIYENFTNAAYAKVLVNHGNPEIGDIMFWDATYGGGDGHTGVVTDVGPTGMIIFEQNDPLGSPAHLQFYNFNHLAGWFHPVAEENEVPVTKQDVDNLLPLLLPNEPVTPESYNFVGFNFHDFIYYVVQTQAFQDDVKKLKE